MSVSRCQVKRLSSFCCRFGGRTMEQINRSPRCPSAAQQFLDIDPVGFRPPLAPLHRN
jgi:hypothetical protein